MVVVEWAFAIWYISVGLGVLGQLRMDKKMGVVRSVAVATFWGVGWGMSLVENRKV